METLSPRMRVITTLADLMNSLFEEFKKDHGWLMKKSINDYIEYELSLDAASYAQKEAELIIENDSHDFQDLFYPQLNTYFLELIATYISESIKNLDK